MKKILIFSIAYFPYIGGAEVAIKEIAERLVNRKEDIDNSAFDEAVKGKPAFVETVAGKSASAETMAGKQNFEFDLITSRFSKQNKKEEQIGAIRVFRVGFGLKIDKYFLPFLGFLKAIQLHKKNKYNFIWAMMANQAGLGALFFHWQSKLPLFLTEQSGDSEAFIWRRIFWFYPLYKRIYICADYIQTISKYLAGRARRFGYKGEIEIIPNGVDLIKYNYKNFDLSLKTELKKELGIKDDEKIILTVSRLEFKNGVLDLISAMSFINYPFKLLIIGEGRLDKKLQFLTKKLKLENKILFLGKILPDNLPKYYFLADIFIRSSLSEGLGNVFLEAMACGTPIIGTAVGGIPDFLENGKTGLFCEPKNSKDIAEKASILIKNESLRKELIKNGLKLVQENYSWDLIADKMRKLFLNF